MTAWWWALFAVALFWLVVIAYAYWAYPRHKDYRPYCRCDACRANRRWSDR